MDSGDEGRLRPSNPTSTGAVVNKPELIDGRASTKPPRCSRSCVDSEVANAAVRGTDADRAAAVDAGLLAQAHAWVPRAGSTSDKDVEARAASGMRVTEATLHCADAVSRHYNRIDDVVPVDWSRFGVVIPVLAASPGSGATVTAVALADALQLAGRSVLMIDTADPARSGMNRATRSDGPQVRGPHPHVRIRFSWRAQAVLARAETPLPVLAPGMLPPPQFWQPADRHVDVTVVDIGHDPWRVSAHPLTGAGMWLRTGSPSPQPIMVVRPTVPALAHVEQVLARLEPWISVGMATRPVQLMATGAKRWPEAVAGAAGRRTQPLLPDTVFLPHHHDVARYGVTTDVTPTRLLSAAEGLLQRWNLISETKPSPHRRTHARRLGRKRGNKHE